MPAGCRPRGRAIVGLALVGEQVEHRADVVRRDPAVRQVAEEARLARVARDDLGPLVPAGGPLVARRRSRAASQRALAPAEPHEGCRRCAARRACRRSTSRAPSRRVDELAPVALEGRCARARRAACRARRPGASAIGASTSGRSRRARPHPGGSRCRARSCWRRSRRAGRARNSSRCAANAASRRPTWPSAVRELDARCDSRGAPRSRPSTSASAWRSSPRG